MCDPTTQVIASCRPRPAISVPPPPDHAPVLEAHNKLTVLLMLAIESDAAEPERMASSSFAEDQMLLIGLSDQRWHDVSDALDQIEELVIDRVDPDRDRTLRAHLRSA